MTREELDELLEDLKQKNADGEISHITVVVLNDCYETVVHAGDLETDEDEEEEDEDEDYEDEDEESEDA